MAKWKICPTCRGEGTSSAHLGVINEEDARDGEFMEDYCAGRYDRPCERCGGTGKVNRASESRRSERRSDLYQQWCESGRPEGSFSDWSGM